MGFNYQKYNEIYLENAVEGGQPINDAAAYEVRIIPAEVAAGESYWQVIGIHHLLPVENQGKHNVFLEALAENGQRVKDPYAWAGWTWEGRHPDERADPVPLDKSIQEPAGNIVMYYGQIVSVWINGLAPDAAEKSDRVENLHTNHPDELGPNGEVWNSIGHHSFYLVFQRTRRGVEPPPPEGYLITGQVAGGLGYTVRLFQGQTLFATQVIGQDLAYRFEGLPVGDYRVEAVGPCLQRDQIRLSQENPEAKVHLSV